MKPDIKVNIDLNAIAGGICMGIYLKSWLVGMFSIALLYSIGGEK